MPFNTEQQEAILHKEGPALVLAGPGSGKTTVITGRIAALLQIYHIPPSQILVISFTRAASREIEDRFREQYPNPAPVCFGTIHAFFYRMLRISRPGTAYSVLPGNLRRQWIKEILSELFHETGWPPERIRQAEEYLLAGGESGAAAADKGFFLKQGEQEALREAYEKRKQQESMLDFEDILAMSRDMFRREPELLAYWQNQFRYILIDEYQDTSPLQLELLRLLAGENRNLFAVGDDDQSIYAFRGADSGLMLRFARDFPGARLYRLSACYRCSPEILGAAASFISHNKDRYGKDLKSLAASGPRPALTVFSQEGRELRALIADMRKKGLIGNEKNSAAILCRSRFSLRRVAAALAGEGIPFVCDEGPAADHSHWIAEDLFAYLRLGQGIGSREDYLQILNKPLRYLSRYLFQEERIDRHALLAQLWEKPRMAGQLMDLFKHLDRLGGLLPFAAVEYIRREIGYDRYLQAYASQRGLTADVFREILDRLQEESADFATVQAWEAARDALLRREKETKDPIPGAPALMTMHGAKGLEFDQVYIPFLCEEEIPGSRSLGKEQAEEERRLLYVAMTRARQGLWLSCTAAKRGGRSRPSRFLKEIKGLILQRGD